MTSVEGLTPPRAERRPTSRAFHGLQLDDPYAWLRADNWQEVMRRPEALQADIRAYLEAENAYAKALLGPLDPLKETLVAEMRGRIKEDDSSVPVRDGPFDYAVRYRTGGQHPLIVRTPAGGNGAEAILLDGDALAEGRAFFQFGSWSASPDHALLAWSADDAGSEFLTIRVRDLATGQDLADVVPDSTGAAVWSADGAGFWYVRLDAQHRALEVWRHRLGTDVAVDELVFREPQPGWFVGVEETRSGAFCVVTISDHDTTEAHLIDRASLDNAPRLVLKRETGVRYELDHHPDLDGKSALILRTNADGAVDFKLSVLPAVAPDAAPAVDLVSHRPGVYVLDHAVTARHLVRLEREDGLPRIVVRALTDGEEHAIAFDEEAYSLGVAAGPTFDVDLTRFSYSSPATPAETWDYDMATRARTLRKRQEVPSGHDPDAYVVRRIPAPAPDGEQVPVTVVHRKGLALDGSAPCLLYGYGAYGISIPASFSGGRLSLVDRGFVYAIAHIRGGTEKGWGWYLDGKLTKKPNTFTDFIAAGEALVAQGFTAKTRIVAHGGSAGGMLMGAVANLRPDLFAAVMAEVAFVDVLTTMLDDTLPLTPPEWPEWGNPILDKDAFERIRSYSPIDNVAPQPYPAILALAGLTDPRVTYWEPAKWIARLREATTSRRPIALRTNMDAGHGGASGRFDRLEEVALAYAFALAAVGHPDAAVVADRFPTD